MSKDIKVPEVGESITEGMLTAWLKEEGELIEQEDPLFELETDKITMEVPSPYSGRLHIEVPAGETVRVGQVVGHLVEQKDTSSKADASRLTTAAQAANRSADVQATSATANSETTDSKTMDSPPGSREDAHAQTKPMGNSAQAPSRLGVPGFGPSAPAAAARIPAQGPRPLSDEASPQRPGMIDPGPLERLRSQARDTADLSPAVRRLVVEHQLTPEEISASGPGGRLTKADVLDYLESGRQLPEAAVPAAGVPLVSDGDFPAKSAHASGSTRHDQTRRDQTKRDQTKRDQTGRDQTGRDQTGRDQTGRDQTGRDPTGVDQGRDEGAEAPRLAARPPATASLASHYPRDSRQTRAKMSPLRSRIAERLVQAQQTAAMLTTFNEVDMSAVLGLRERFKAPFEKKHGVRLGFMSFFVKAAVDALKAVPQVNAFIEGDEIVTNHFYDIGVAVGTDRGLVVPVIRDCDHLDFAGIERAIGEYARRVKEKRIGLEDLQGGCFTLSNGGVYGSLLSTPILNPPQSGILGMHAIKKRPVVIDDQIVIRPMMYLALSYDHRLVDGKNAVTFLRRIVECLEAPERMLMDV